MRGPRVILAAGLLIVGLLGAFIYFGPAGPASRYRRFMGKDTAYYAQVARACDAVLQEHPIGSSGLQPYAGLPGSFSLSVTPGKSSDSEADVNTISGKDDGIGVQSPDWCRQGCGLRLAFGDIAL